MPNIYKNKPDAFKSIQKRSLRITIPIVLMAISLGLGIGFNRSGDDEVNTLPFSLAIAIGAVTFGVFRGLNRQRKIFESFVLTIGDDLIQREQLMTPTVAIKIAEVKDIVRNQNGSFIITGQRKGDVIAISHEIENRDDLELELKKVKLIKEQVSSLSQKLLLPSVFLTMILMAVVYVSTNRYLVLISGIALTLWLIWSVYQIQTSKNVDNKTRRTSWWIIIVIFSIIASTYAKFVNLG